MNSFELIQKDIIVDPEKITALGIGDILISLVLLKK